MTDLYERQLADCHDELDQIRQSIADIDYQLATRSDAAWRGKATAAKIHYQERERTVRRECTRLVRLIDGTSPASLFVQAAKERLAPKTIKKLFDRAYEIYLEVSQGGDDDPGPTASAPVTPKPRPPSDGPMAAGLRRLREQMAVGD